MKRVKNLLYLSVLSLGLMATSCSDDANIDLIDDTDDTPVTGGTDLTGSLEEDMTLDASKTYNLTGTFSIESGVTLTIPAGTEIVADATSSSSDETEVYIVVQKGGNIEINGTSSSPVIIRAASNRAGSWGGLVIAGNASTTAGLDAEAEVGGILYGGGDDTDSSGSIKYLILKDAGASINPESQYNGLSLYAVGSGTSIQNVAITNGADDGVEFFGGTVSVTNLYLEDNEDDAVDWTEGWSGTITNTYVLHTIGNFSTAIEADGEDNSPKINNFTAVSTTGGTALQFKKNSGAIITGLSLSGYDKSLDIADANRTDLANIQINGSTVDQANAYAVTPTVDASLFNWIDNRGSVSVLPASVDNDFSLDGNTQYVLSGIMSVEEGATLTIPAGTTITARSDSNTEATSIYIVVQKGGMIDIQGTESNPVIMKSTTGQAGSWGGLVIAGDAPTTAGTNAEAEVGGILYGGNTSDDNSGSIQYLILKDAGASINPESQYNGLSLYAVGSGTTIENIAIMNGADDGVEFFGGTVSVTNIYLEDNEDDAVDWTEGWNGTITNTYVLHTIGNFSTAIEADGENNNPMIVNFTAVSETGGTALQFKKNSGATITGLSLTGYDTVLDIADDNRTDLSGIQLEGITATLEATFEVGATVDVSTFNWAK
ncbi:hypothetical protein [Christiangramia sp. SM2212]|uniref:Uncharacterized protein n=1 Tax=Christiangramia sediminicola TaxID=3073267 RepID=A0ABU1ELS1_9FLAO|nr:hypothetical protein [Christiangramia sp. SM2212]MDR5589296.1 hypothetical protein [Christiangramia sp. SM2212]